MRLLFENRQKSSQKHHKKPFWRGFYSRGASIQMRLIQGVRSISPQLENTTIAAIFFQMGCHWILLEFWCPTKWRLWNFWKILKIEKISTLGKKGGQNRIWSNCCLPPPGFLFSVFSILLLISPLKRLEKLMILYFLIISNLLVMRTFKIFEKNQETKSFY